MLYNGIKKKALQIHERAVKKYNITYKTTQEKCETLYKKRKASIELVNKIEDLINSIANNPKEFEESLQFIKIKCAKFNETEKYAIEAYQAAVKSGINIAAGVAGGTAFASMAPTTAMWVATTFGTASTGTAISSLSGAVATKAALAWLGGGALTAGGTGIAGGQALLALAGPIGWGITGMTIVTSLALLGNKNKKISEEAIEETKKITSAGAELYKMNEKINSIINKTEILFNKLNYEFDQVEHLKCSNYINLSSSEQIQLGTLVNHTLSLTEMLNKIIK